MSINKIINVTSDKTYLFNMGDEAGFFSEYNNMIFSIAYCHKHNINFSLYSKNAIFSNNVGWTEFFEPFCKESTNILNKYFNKSKGFKIIFHLIGRALLKKTSKVNYLTSDFWDDFRGKDFEKETFDISKNKTSISLLDFCKIIDSKIWIYNKRTKNIIDLIVKKAEPSQPYISFHIRAGDKEREAKLFSFRKYIEQAEKISQLKTAFIATDDYTVVENLREHYPNWKFTTLTKEFEKGYTHGEAKNLTASEKKDSYLRLLASIDILANSDLFVGTSSSNIGRYIAMKMSAHKIKYLDTSEWRITRPDDILTEKNDDTK